MEESRLPRASRTEILGQWLGIWTAPRDRYVPPPPVRKLVVLGALGLVLAAVAAVVVANLIEDAKERREARAARAQAALVAREKARLRVDQAPHTGRASRPGVSRAVLIGDLEHAISADAASRYRRRLVPDRVESTSCAPFVRPAVPNPPQPPPGAREGKYECIALTGQVGGTAKSVGASVGYPFWARVDFGRSSWVYCKVNRRPGEMGTGAELAFVPLTPACDLLRR